MTVEIPVPEGPPCDFCTDWPAVGTLMNLADYTTQKFCANCGPEFLLGIVSAMTGADVTAAGGEAPAGGDARGAQDDAPPAGHQAAEDECPVCGAMVSLSELDAHQQTPECQSQIGGSAADHWASTKRVVRSTHGHRGGKTAAPAPPDTEAGP